MKRALFFQRSCKIQVKVLETPESDPKVIAARKQLMAFKPVWKNNSLV